MKNIKKILDSLSPNERKILPHIEEKDVVEICKRSNLDKVSVIRSLEYLKDKKIINLNREKKKIVELGVNGALYKKKGFPERRLLDILKSKRILGLDESKNLSKLSGDEFKASIGVLKRKALVDIKNKKIILNALNEEIAKKTPEESLLNNLPLEKESLSEEQSYALGNLEKRKDILYIKEKSSIQIKITEMGEKIIKEGLKGRALIEQITPEFLKKDSSWKGKKFRRYNVEFPVSNIYGGKRHFVNQAIDYARRIWTDLGFQEMTGPFVQSSFWNFDALFTPQDHPVREMQDTFFLSSKIQGKDTPDKDLVKRIKNSHEKGVKTEGGKSEGWKYVWDEEQTKELVLRTHTTCLSAKTLSSLKLEELPKKFFALGKCFRNETVDWSHGFEFNQTEGIVIDKNANFRHLLGYLKQFFGKMGFEKVRFRPAYFPYTEPSVEIDFWNSERKVWLELGGAGMFRPEVTIPLLGENIPVLAWGPGFDRIIMDNYKIKDLRELYKNDLNQLRKIKFWMK